MNATNKKISMEEIFSEYLDGGLIKSLEGNINIFDSPKRLLFLGYEQFGTEDEYLLFEKYYPVGANKGFTFKVYFYKNKPWMSAISFFRFKLDFTLNASKHHLKKIDVFFDKSDFENGALIINDTCVLRFEFIKNKYPRALTLETIATENTDTPKGKTKIEIISNQFLKINPSNLIKSHKNAQKIFEIIEKYCPIQ